VGDITFREIYHKFGWNLNITVTDKNESRLLNYLTAPNVLIWSAIVASCAIPGMFDCADLMMKGENGDCFPYCPPSRDIHFTDGSVAGDLPMQRLSELFNINTFIVSQVNPHIAPFISENKAEVLETFNLRTSFFLLIKTLCGNEIKHVTK
jgi:TAG lipase/steryl ester hydrolase/phospholipase A2/LPA acyltransferase